MSDLSWLVPLLGLLYVLAGSFLTRSLANSAEAKLEGALSARWEQESKSLTDDLKGAIDPTVRSEIQKAGVEANNQVHVTAEICQVLPTGFVSIFAVGIALLRGGATETVVGVLVMAVGVGVLFVSFLVVQGMNASSYKQRTFLRQSPMTMVGLLLSLASLVAAVAFL